MQMQMRETARAFRRVSPTYSEMAEVSKGTMNFSKRYDRAQRITVILEFRSCNKMLQQDSTLSRYVIYRLQGPLRTVLCIVQELRRSAGH